jgi:hypothetical protein
VRDEKGQIYSVRYEQVNAMLLNEFLKEHRKVEQLRKDFESKLAEQQKQIEALTGGPTESERPARHNESVPWRTCSEQTCAANGSEQSLRLHPPQIKQAAVHNQPSRFTALRLFVSRCNA